MNQISSEVFNGSKIITFVRESTNYNKIWENENGIKRWNM